MSEKMNKQTYFFFIKHLFFVCISLSLLVTISIQDKEILANQSGLAIKNPITVKLNAQIANSNNAEPELEWLEDENKDEKIIRGSGEDTLFNQAVSIVTKDNRVSISYVQRKLQIGYNRAARIIEEMEEKGIVSPPNNQGKRELLKDSD